MQISRAAQALLIALGMLPVAWRASQRWPPALLPVLLALAWLGLAQLWTPIPEMGLQTLVLRATACAAALGFALWVQREPDGRLPWACGMAGLGILAMNAATQTGLGIALGIGADAPFGNVNFVAHTALPLIAIAVACGLRTSPRYAVLMAVAAIGIGSILGLGLRTGDPCRAVWLGLAAATSGMVVLCLQARLHALLLLAGAVALLAGWIASFNGLLDPAHCDWGAAQRIYMWRAAVEALAGPQALIGHGTASCLAILPEQPSFVGVWLTLPGWTSHPHNEILNVLLDGGLVLAGLLAWALWSTLMPLWRSREQPLCAALLVGWITFACGAMIETHLREPGGMLILALLAGLSWAQAPMVSLTHRLPGLVLALPALALTSCVVYELLGDGGTPANISWRALVRTSQEHPEDFVKREAEFKRLRQRLGPINDVDYEISVAIGRQGRLAESIPPLIAHLHRLPCHAPGLALAARIRKAGRAPPELQAAETSARQLALRWLELVPENERNREVRTALRTVLAEEGASPAP